MVLETISEPKKFLIYVFFWILKVFFFFLILYYCVLVLDIYVYFLTDHVQASQRSEWYSGCKKFNHMLNWLSAARSRWRYGMHLPLSSCCCFVFLSTVPTSSYLWIVVSWKDITNWICFSYQTMVNLMGAQFSKPLVANKVTHLICYKFEGAFPMFPVTKGVYN